jgi:hypothetical protein
MGNGRATLPNTRCVHMPSANIYDRLSVRVQSWKDLTDLYGQQALVVPANTFTDWNRLTGYAACFMNHQGTWTTGHAMCLNGRALVLRMNEHGTAWVVAGRRVTFAGSSWLNKWLK